MFVHRTNTNIPGELIFEDLDKLKPGHGPYILEPSWDVTLPEMNPCPYGYTMI